MGRPRRRQALGDSSSWTPAIRQNDVPRETAESREKMVIRVRRGALRRFDQLKSKSAGLPVEIEWDRRVADRRSSAEPSRAERRAGERRQAPPFTWEVADFLVVGDTSSSQSHQDPDDPPRKKR